MPLQTQQHEQQRDTETQPARVECRYHGCSEHGNKWEFRDGKYCGTECETKARGREALKSCRYDHTLCFTCLQPMKDIEPPKPDFEFVENGHGWTRDEETGEPTLEYYSQTVTADAACGWQHRTQWTDDGEKQRFGLIVTGVICGACGNTDHSHHEACLADRDAIGRLVSLLVELDDWSVDVHTLHREYENTRDVDLAVGRGASEDE